MNYGVNKLTTSSYMNMTPVVRMLVDVTSVQGIGVDSVSSLIIREPLVMA